MSAANQLPALGARTTNDELFLMVNLYSSLDRAPDDDLGRAAWQRPARGADQGKHDPRQPDGHRQHGDGRYSAQAASDRREAVRR